MDAVTDLVKQKIWAGVETRVGIKAEELQVYADPARKGAYAIRADFGQIFEHFELLGYHGQNAEWIALNVTHVQYLDWPPFRAALGS